MLDLNGVSKVYGSGEVKVVALDNVTFKVNQGDYIAITGPSGRPERACSIIFRLFSISSMRTV